MEPKTPIEKLVEETGIKAGDIFVDIGSNIGQEIAVLAPMGVIIYSYEPHPKYAAILRDKYGHLPNVHLNEVAVFTHEGETDLYCKKDPEAINGGPSIFFKYNNLREPSYKVKLVDIAVEIRNILSKHKKIKVLKVDSEGCEFHIFNHLYSQKIDMSQKGIEWIYFEDHKQEVYDPDYEPLSSNIWPQFAERGNVRLW